MQKMLRIQWHYCFARSKISNIPRQPAQAGSSRIFSVRDPRSHGNFAVTVSKISKILWKNKDIRSRILKTSDPGSWGSRIQDLGTCLVGNGRDSSSGHDWPTAGTRGACAQSCGYWLVSRSYSWPRTTQHIPMSTWIGIRQTFKSCLHKVRNVRWDLCLPFSHAFSTIAVWHT